MKQNKIKLVIFDFDHTLYSGKLERKKNYNYNMLRTVFDDLNNKQFAQLLQKYNIKRKNSLTSDTVVAIAIAEGKDTFNTTSRYMAINDENIQKTDQTLTIDNEVIENLIGQGYKVCVVSNSPLMSVKRNAKALGIDLSLVDIKGMPYVIPYKNYKQADKKLRYQDILNQYGLQPHEGIVFGNDYLADIVPAKHLGLKGIVCQKASQLTMQNIQYCIMDNEITDIAQVDKDDYRMYQQLKKDILPTLPKTITVDELINNTINKKRTKHAVPTIQKEANNIPLYDQNEMVK